MPRATPGSFAARSTSSGAQRCAAPPRSSAAAADADARRSSVFVAVGAQLAIDVVGELASRRARACRARCPRTATRAPRDRRAAARARRARPDARAPARRRDRRRRSRRTASRAPWARMRAASRRAGSEPVAGASIQLCASDGCASRPSASSPIEPGAVSGADSTTSSARAQAFARDDLRRRSRERDEQPHERVAIGIAQPRQHAATELATLGARRQRLRELEQRDRGGGGRQPVEIAEHAVGRARCARASSS